MLGRTASSLYWMARYMERVENLARLVEVGHRISLMPGFDGRNRNEWESTLTAAACLDSYRRKYDEAQAEHVIEFMLFDTDNSTSVRSCLEAARNNGRGVRSALTRDMWEALNSAYVEFSSIRPSHVKARRLPELLDWIRNQAMLFRGSMLGTLLRTPGYHFSQLGAFVERADQTARILDVKYYILLPRSEPVGGEVDTQQWETILRSVSAHRSYRHFYHHGYRPWSVADFLILRPEMPRSLHNCYSWIDNSVKGLCEAYATDTRSLTLAEAMLYKLKNTNMDAIFRSGLHEFLSDFLARNNELGQQIGRDYHFV